ncbi:MAG TPA: oligopeptide transporter, OPT family [Oleiagrimonas sp.]|nr:oligopeptide transporter, OPT family [Oleiagrimonas sp.]
MNAQQEAGFEPRSELTVRGVIIGVLITLVFTAANVYFGLKAGLTFATSIPAAVISMAILRKVGSATIQENNIVQTIASSAGCLSAIIFVLPGLVIVGWWAGFPYWETMLICALGGILGVMYSIPLRRALVTGSDLPYPEGVACAEVLKVGARSREAAAAAPDDAGKRMDAGKAGFLAVLWGSIASAAFQIIQATHVFGSSVAAYFRVGDRGATGFNFSLSLALFGVGHLVGLWVGISMLIGTAVAWAWAMPHFSALAPVTGSVLELVDYTYNHTVRFLGAGTIGAAAIWALVKLIKPVVTGLVGALRSQRLRKSGQGGSLPRTEYDIPIGIVAMTSLVLMLPIGWLLAFFGNDAGLGEKIWVLVIGGVVFIALISFFVAAIVGYMAGLVGSSNSPISGVGILVAVIASVLLALGVQPYMPAGSGKALVAFALFASSVVFASCTIANDNLQDLKTGQLVDATPWKQQVALVIGVIAGAFIIPFVLNMLGEAYGFAGGPNATDHALAAPQAGLISALAKGILQHHMQWNLIWIGAGIGAAFIILDEVLGKLGSKVRFPPLAVGLGVYLPSDITLMIAVGALVGWFFNHRADKRDADPESRKQLGVLLSSGLIVGESILGVIIAAIVVFSGRAAPLALVGEGFAGTATWIGGLAFVLVVAGLYRWISRLGPSGTRGD